MTERADFGARLRAAREARGISLQQIAATTKISVFALEALERQDISRLPGGLFSRAFVRAYAKEVGLDPEEAVREFVERVADDDDPVMSEAAIRARASRPDQDPGPSHTGLRWLGLVITVLLVVVFFAVQRYLTRQPAPGRPAEPKGSSMASPQAPIGANLAAPPAAPATPVPVSDAGPLPDASNPPAGGAAAPTPSAESAGETPGTEPANAAVRVALSVDSACWVSAKADGKQSVRRTLQAGERVELAAAGTLVLTVGNPAAVVYTVNGMPGRTLGPANQVVTVVIDASNVQTFAR